MRVFAAALILCVSSVPVFAAGGNGVAREACKADVSSLCQGVERGNGRIKACLKTNKDKLSEGCRSAITTAMLARKAAKAPGTPAPTVMSPVVP